MQHQNLCPDLSSCQVRDCPILQVSAKPATARSAGRPITIATLTVRPYTARKGDTLESIAQKRDVTVKEIIALNLGIDPNKVEEKQTILIPGGKLSSRDKEILAGIGRGTYRTYPVRAGESIKDIISKRNITRAEVDALNPEVNLDKLASAQVIKLPANKYTVREREMLSGVAGAPESYFLPGNPFSNALFGGEPLSLSTASH
ncbi:hypothetical protein COCSUDRAFT_16385 [Coccomyxa subellipsoidea C-169]|uniref:LysM domain-containing protein n=1 Tax=Coccomyxa subellipsoidea (strain C-169) TaxID=574566 RepID=I0YW73_COCSC|nr:hypothetical protein COCSUDRAFT_16385 [Coccomyxa subellipsoidea C-169]EIE22642.1 hypothetical protein COCSUDRAFT_16385 [Coccomyxa subellipsoidea C-169]|eukprot:XP_005647186.1 hypothetical protein COCSUDRAFT_16385 [Coccomyxa subellipsoidea C-169]